MMTEPSRLDRELPPYITQHALKKHKQEPAREPGREVEVLTHDDFHKRQRRYQRAIRQLRDLAADDAALYRRAQEAGAVSLPSSAGGGSRHTGVSDPTYLAAVRPHISDPAERALKCIDVATLNLGAAMRYRKRALYMIDAEGVLAEMDEEGEAAPSGEWCSNCIQCVIDKRPVLNPRGLPKDVGKESTLCRGCHDFEREHGFPMPQSLIRKRARQGKLYPRDVELALRSAQPQKPDE